LIGYPHKDSFLSIILSVSSIIFENDEKSITSLKSGFYLTETAKDYKLKKISKPGKRGESRKCIILLFYTDFDIMQLIQDKKMRIR